MHHDECACSRDFRDFGDNVFHKLIKFPGSMKNKNPDNIPISGATAQIINIGALYQMCLDLFSRAYLNLDAHDAHEIQSQLLGVGYSAYLYRGALHQAPDPVTHRAFGYIQFPSDFPETLPGILLKFPDYFLSQFVNHITPPENNGENFTALLYANSHQNANTGTVCARKAAMKAQATSFRSNPAIQLRRGRKKSALSIQL
jgi:hypothetical protein